MIILLSKNKNSVVEWYAIAWPLKHAACGFQAWLANSLFLHKIFATFLLEVSLCYQVKTNHNFMKV
jgi:hypothetical protein